MPFLASKILLDGTSIFLLDCLAMKPDLYQFSITRLQKLQGRWPEIADAVGVSYSWLTKFAAGRVPNAAYRRVAALADYLKKL